MLRWQRELKTAVLSEQMLFDLLKYQYKKQPRTINTINYNNCHLTLSLFSQTYKSDTALQLAAHRPNRTPEAPGKGGKGLGLKYLQETTFHRSYLTL